MKAPLISIIVPVYNGEKEVGRCLDSIYTQGCPANKFEVICVNDCSPHPETLETLQSYRNKLIITPPIR